MRPKSLLALVGSIAAVGLGPASCGMALPSERPLGRGPLALNQAPAEPKRAAPEVVSAGPEEPAGGAEDAAAPSSGRSEPVVAVAAVADGGSAASAAQTPVAGDAGPAKLDFSGEYVGKDREVLRMDGAPELPMGEDANAKTRVRTRADGNLDIIFVASDTGAELCKLEAKPNGNVAALTRGQTCKSWQEFLGPLRSGGATFSGKQLVVDAEFEASMDDGEERLEGIWSYHFEGTRR
jgi:hypothetical protein